MQIANHPLMQKIVADVAEANAKEAQAIADQQMEASRVRQERGQFLNREFQARIAEYEALRAQIHAKVGEVWIAVQDYSRLTGATPPGYLESTFMRIDVPSLVVSPSPYAWSSPHSTTRVGVDSWFASVGRTWV